MNVLADPQIKQCVGDLQSSDPRDDKSRIAAGKDDLLRDSYAWILDDNYFLSWLSRDDTQILWIKGEPGKGKTMMMMALEKELSDRLETTERDGILSYFFCQNTDDKLNNAVAIVKGLIFLLVVQQPDLTKHLLEEPNPAWKDASRGKNALHALWRVLCNILNDLVESNCVPIYLMIDALDECDESLSQFLELITKNLPSLPNTVKWLLASRPHIDIDTSLSPERARSKIDLELNSKHIAYAVSKYVDFKVQQLSEKRKYNKDLRKIVTQYLHDNSEGTFLWVALVCKELEKVELWKTKKILKQFPPGLTPLYDRMARQIMEYNKDTLDFCSRTLSAVALAIRPLKLKELVAVARLPREEFRYPEAIAELVGRCGSFLTLRDDTASFVHQSAKDYLLESGIFPTAQSEHLNITHNLLQAMGVLKYDICGIKTYGPILDDPKASINLVSLERIGYACCYWIDHLCAASAPGQDKRILLSDGGEINQFLDRHFLHWLESLSLLGRISAGISMIRKLLHIVQVCRALPRLRTSY